MVIFFMAIFCMIQSENLLTLKAHKTGLQQTTNSETLFFNFAKNDT